MAKKGQAALEYLSTYGWLLIIIVIVAAALYALGIFNPATYQGKSCTGFTTGITYTEHRLASDGTFTLVATNGVGKTVSSVTGLNMTIGASSFNGAVSLSPAGTWAPGAKKTLSAATLITGGVGDSYTATVTINYNTGDITGHKQTGTCTGTYE